MTQMLTNYSFNKELNLELAVKAYESGKDVVIRFHDQEWYAAYLQNKKLDMSGITLDMLPHARYFVEG